MRHLGLVREAFLMDADTSIPPGRVDATRTQKEALKDATIRKPAGRLDGRGLTAGRRRPPRGGVVDGSGKAGRAKQRAGAARPGK